MQRVRTRWAVVGLFLAAIVVFLIAAWLARSASPTDAGSAHAWAFGVMAVGNIALFAAIGQAITDSPFGILYTGRNTCSLSRLQMVAWTVLVMAALMTAAVGRAWATGLAKGLDLSIPDELLQVMGISYVSAAATPAILALKSQDPTTDQVDAASGRMGEPLVGNGQLVHRPDGAAPEFMDMIRSDDLGSAGLVDLGKVQQLMMTFLVISVYAGALTSFFLSTPFSNESLALPHFSGTFVTLLLVSHGGYLAIKAVPKPDSSAGAAPQRPSPPADRNAA